MWDFFIALISVSIIGFFLYRRLRRSPDKTKIVGKYASLIAELSEGKPRYLKSVVKSVKFELKKGRDQYVYMLTETEGKLLVVWTIESHTYGRRGKEWSFDSTLDQTLIADTIGADLRLYLKNIHNT